MANKLFDIDNYPKIEVTNSSNDKGIFQKIYNIKVFSKSRELRFLQKISEEKKKYYDLEIIDKLFNHYKIRDKENANQDLYLKNKYLYLTTRGVMNYLRFYHVQKTGVNKNYYDFELEIISNYIKKRLLGNDGRFSVISLGAANSDKEAKIFNDLRSDQLKKLVYIPIDISNYLIHLGIIELSSKEILKELEVNSIIADFWDLADYIQENDKKKTRKELFSSNKNIFLLLGGTFGNYTEKEFLDKIIELMNVEDELIISLKLKKEKKESRKNICDEYDHPSDSEFLMEPLTYIPYFYGYTIYHRDLLEKGTKAELTDSDDDKKFVSVVPKSDCYAPFIKVKDTEHLDRKLRLAWTTRYDKESLINWIENYRSGDNNKGDYIFRKRCMETENDYALIFLKKDWYDYTEEIDNKLGNDIGAGYHSSNYKKIVTKLSIEKKSILYNEIKEISETKKLKSIVTNYEK